MRRLQIFFFVSMFIGGVLSLLAPLSASAEIRIIEGIPFEVDEIVELKDGTVKVTIDDISKIINAKHVDDYIASFYFKNDKELTVLQLKKYINNALSSSRLTRAALGMNAYLKHPSFYEEDGISFVKSLNDSAAKGLIKLYQYLLLSSKDLFKYPMLAANLVLSVGMQDSAWVKKSFGKQLNQVTKSLKDVIASEYADAVKNKNFKAATKILRLEESVFGKDDLNYQKHLTILKQIRSASEQMRHGEFLALHALIDLAKKDQQIAKNLTPFLVSAIHDNAEDALSRHDYKEALKVLAMIDPRWRTETTHLLSKNCFEEIVKKNLTVVIDNTETALFVDLALKDAALKEVFLNFLELQFHLALADNRGASAEHLFSAIIQLRLDPDKRNDALRSEHIRFFVKNNQIPEARWKRSEMQTSLSFVDKIRFLFYFSGWKVLLLVVLFVVLFVVTLRIIKDPKIKRSHPKESRPPQDHLQDNESIDRPLFIDSMATAGLRTNPLLQEYLHGLDKLGLDRDADTKAIKAAYRGVAKKLHPDTHPNQSEEDSRKFIEFSETYERVLILRKELGLPE
ncbi:MAG: J domain-containing protein [Bdellovibrionota bacterium]|jgi:hypothetical protein